MTFFPLVFVDRLRPPVGLRFVRKPFLTDRNRFFLFFFFSSSSDFRDFPAYTVNSTAGRNREFRSTKKKILGSVPHRVHS